MYNIFHTHPQAPKVTNLCVWVVVQWVEAREGFKHAGGRHRLLTPCWQEPKKLLVNCADLHHLQSSHQIRCQHKAFVQIVGAEKLHPLNKIYIYFENSLFLENN